MQCDRGRYGSCHACSRQFSGSCICGPCLNQGLGDLASKLHELKEKKIHCEATLNVLLEKQVTIKSQQHQIALLRSNTHQTRISAERARSKLQALSSTYHPAESDASLGRTRVTLSSAVKELGTNFEAQRAAGTKLESQLTRKLQNEEAELREGQKRALEDITSILANTLRPPESFDTSRISSATDLVELCAGNKKISKYYSDAFGQLMLFFSVAGSVLHLPLRHRYQFGGGKTRISLPTEFWEITPSDRNNTHTLYFSASSSSGAETHRKSVVQALAALERTVAVATAARPSLRPRRSLMASPVDWIEDLCVAAIHECVYGGGDDDDEGMSSQCGGDVNNSNYISQPTTEDDDDDSWEWELMMAEDVEKDDRSYGGGGATANSGGGGGSTSSSSNNHIPSFNSVLDKVKTLAHNYKELYYIK